MDPFAKLTDEQLTALLKNGDEQAFAEIYKRYAGKLAGFASSKLYSLDDARDILHDIFAMLWEKRGQLYISTNLQSYLFGMVRHRIIDKIRKNVTREGYAAVQQSLAAALEPGVDKQAEARELEQTIQKLLNELPPRVKEIYKLSREKGLSNREIAKKLSLSEQTVKNQLSAALKHLKKSLAGVSALIIALGAWL